MSDPLASALDSLSVDDLELDEQTPEVAEPAPEAEAEAPAAEPQVDGDGTEPPAPPATATETPPPEPEWVPKGEPFKFKVDATEVSPEGALVTPHGVLIPQKAWDDIRGKYLGNRDVWRQQQAQWQQRVQQVTEQVTRAQQEAQVAQTFVKSLIDEAQADPEKFIGRLDQLIATLPMKVKDAELRLYQERESQREQERQQYEAAQQQERLETDLQSFLAQQVESAIAADFKALAPTRDEAAELLRELYDRHGLELFEGITVDQAHLAAQQGWQMLTQVGDRLIGWYPDRFRGQLERRAERQKALVARYTQTQKVETRNQAALTAPKVVPAKAAPKSAPKPRDTSTGQFTKPSQREVLRQSRKMLDDLSLDDIDD